MNLGMPDENLAVCQECSDCCKPKWTSVDIGLPPENVPVFVISELYPEQIHAAVYVYEDGWHWEEYDGCGALNDATCYEWDDDYGYSRWMYMPDTIAQPQDKTG